MYTLLLILYWVFRIALVLSFIALVVSMGSCFFFINQEDESAILSLVILVAVIPATAAATVVLAILNIWVIKKPEKEDRYTSATRPQRVTRE